MKDLLEYLKYSKELTINPFGLSKTSCNNNCKFCIISKRMINNNVSLDHFIKTTTNTKNWLNKHLYELPPDITITFFFVAGELFYLDKQYFDLYKQVAKDLYDIVAKRYIKIRFNIQSNLLLDQEHLVYFIELSKFLMKLSINVCITTSFDLWGRFSTKEQLILWNNNLKTLQSSLDKKIMVEMILTTYGIQNYLQNKEGSEILNEILLNNDKYDISFEDYILNNIENYDLYPTTEDLVSFYTKIKENFPNHSVLSFYKNRISHKYIDNQPRNECILLQFAAESINTEAVYTDDELRIINKNCISSILSNISEHKYDEILQFIPKNNEGLYCLSNKQEVKAYFDNKFGCMYCKYKPFCKPKCFIQSIVKQKPQKCQLKALFELFDNE